MSPDEKICPVCDTKLSMNITKCPICGTDLTAIDEKALEDVDLSLLKDKTKAIDDILSLLEEEEKKVMEKIEKKDAEEKKPEPKIPAPEPEQKEKVQEKKEEKEKTQPAMVDKPAEKVEATKTAEGPQKEVFSCPLCNEQIPIDANACPKCGAIFEEAVVFICPVCHAEVPVDSNTCPKCGAIFVSEEEPAASPEMAGEKAEEEVKAPPEEAKEKTKPLEVGAEEKAEKIVIEEKKPEKKVEKKPEDMAKELALKVSEAKVLLETMRKFGVDEKEIKENISRALSAGKEKDYEKALGIMETALATGKKLVMEKIGTLSTELEAEVRSYSKLGCDVRKGIGLAERVLFAVETENYENAVKLYTQVSDFAKKLKETFEARKKDFDALNRSIAEYSAYGVPGISELKTILEKAMTAYSSGEIAEGDKCLSEVKQKLTDALPNYVSSKIAEQAAKLREEKLLGLDVRDKIEYLKEANICIKKKDFAQALVWVNKLERKEA
ncbi:MAG: zinc ribbon domain-containing protein [Thermoplasmata archaeon]|nr:zinc ribbon domain-containing protein [Thermoplasmata archaeon]